MKYETNRNPDTQTTGTYLSHVQADLEALVAQMNCKHVIVRKPGLQYCLSCTLHIDTCTACGFPTTDNECDWC